MTEQRSALAIELQPGPHTDDEELAEPAFRLRGELPESWLGRQRVRSVKNMLDGDSCEVTGVFSKEQARMIDAWIARHAGPG